MIFEEIYSDIFNSFGRLWHYKERGTSLEIVTPFVTTSHKFVSVFLTKQNDEYVVSDGGWIADGSYENSFDRNIDCYSKAIAHYIEAFNIRELQNSNKISFFYKKTTNKISVPSLAMDVANFISAIISLSGVNYEVERKEYDIFKKAANDFLFTNFSTKVSVNEYFDKTTRHVKPDAIILKDNGKSLLLNYITGTNVTNFRGSIAKSTVIFELAEKSILNNRIEQKIAFIDDQSIGFQLSKVSVWLDNLTEKSKMARVDWSNKEELFNMMN